MPSQERRAGKRPRVLIAGGGVAGVEALLALRALAEEGPAIEVVSPGPDLAYRPLRGGSGPDRDRIFRRSREAR